MDLVAIVIWTGYNNDGPETRGCDSPNPSRHPDLVPGIAKVRTTAFFISFIQLIYVNKQTAKNV